jgi:hypothetical protein
MPSAGALAVEPIVPLQLTVPPQGHGVESRGRLGGIPRCLTPYRWAKLPQLIDA